MQFFPKKPVKSFHDLEVYQQALEANVFVAKYFHPERPSAERPAAEIVRPCGKRSRGDKDAISAGTIAKGSDNFGIGTVIINTLINCSCMIPHLIAEAHSFRFGSQKECLILLEKVMLNCNKMVVYLDQARDICETGIETAQFEDLTKKYFYLRRRVLNLQRSWQKYIGMPKEEKIIRNTNL